MAKTYRVTVSLELVDTAQKRITTLLTYEGKDLKSSNAARQEFSNALSTLETAGHKLYETLIVHP